MKSGILLILFCLSVAAPAHAQFLSTHCKSADGNISVSGFQDATSVLLNMKLTRISPPLAIKYAFINEQGVHEPVVGLHQGDDPIAVPFPDGEKLVFSGDLLTAQFYESATLPPTLLACCQDGAARRKCQ